MATITYSGQLVVTSCWCGIRLAIPDDLHSFARRRHKVVFCPLGHEFVYGDLENDRLKRERAEAAAALEAARHTQQLLRDEVEHERRRVTGYQGALAKQKKRAAKGVCPAPGCKRSFVNVERHVANCHPDLCAAE
jgi:hypothetical protein